MSDIRPFAALRYARDLATRMAPPYDVLDDAERAAFARDPENIVHLTLPPGPSGARDYAGAAQLLKKWTDSGVLVRDSRPALYVSEERIADGRVRRGFQAAVRLAEYSERVILPHERTMAGPKQDRLLLTRAVHANLEPLFFLYEDRAQQLDALLQTALKGPSVIRTRTTEGTELSLAPLTDVGEIEAIRSFLAERPLVIADGHHRYETMLRYRDEQRAERGGGTQAEHEFVLAYLVNAFDPGSRIQAIHRLLSGEIRDPAAVLSGAGFHSEPLSENSPQAVLDTLARRSAAEHVFALVKPGGAVEIAGRGRGSRLDVEVLHEELLPGLGGDLSFDAQPARLMQTLRARRGSLAILMHPLDADALFRTVQAGAVLPQKSTFFAPKIPAGLALRTLDA
jgi:uncharacterized protein (DUF1015 family)